MNKPFEHNKFVFSQEIDNNFIFSLYEDDYSYIEEVFFNTLKHLDPDFQSIQTAFKAEDLAALKKAVHKIKPSFGFVGLSETQDICQKFEDFCQPGLSMDIVQPRYDQLVAVLNESKKVLSSEYKKLKAYNASSLWVLAVLS